MREAALSSSNLHVALSSHAESAASSAVDPSSASVDGAVDIVDGVPKTDEDNASVPSVCLVPTGD